MNTLPVITMFLDYLTDERHFSPYTARCYGADLRQYTEYLVDEHGIEINETSRSPQACVRPRTGRPLRTTSSPTSARRRHRAIVQADADVHPGVPRVPRRAEATPPPPPRGRSRPSAPSTSGRQAELRREQPDVVIRTPRQGKRLPKAITVEQVERLLSTPDDREILGARDRAMLETLYSTGIRVSELVDLDLEDLDLDQRGAPRPRQGQEGAARRRSARHARSAMEHYRDVLFNDAATSASSGARRKRATGHPLFINKHGAALSARVQRPPQARQVPPRGRARPLDQPAHAPPLLRHAPARQRRGPPQRAGAARAPVPEHDAGLHAPHRLSACEAAYDRAHPRAEAG